MIRHLLTIRPLIERLTRRIRRERRKNGKRMLVNEILTIQVLSAAIIGALTIAALYWGGQWVLQDNYGRWALQWTEELNELGSPLFLRDDGEALIRLESFVARYPEIARVSYFDQGGDVLFSVNKAEIGEPVAALSADTLQQAQSLIGTSKPYVLSSGIIDPRKFEILAPVWTESFPQDGLFAFDPADPATRPDMELIGFVGIHLDYLIFHDQLMSNIKIAVLFLLALLIVFAMTGRRALQKALSSISDLQQPIRELAKGNLDVKFKPAEHREIAHIVDALETTASALGERDAKLNELANLDSLTGLYNRRRFVETFEMELEATAGSERPGALFFIDLDQFKYINDSCGHPAGDRLICKVANELRRSIGPDDTVARFGGDEFVVLLRSADKDSARADANAILDNMRQLAHIEEERVFHVHCSIGITLIEAHHNNHDDLLAQADIACREAKLAGRNRMAFYEKSNEKTARASEDVGWMNKLRKAVDENQFELRFQPINRIDTGETTHHEVLIRLRDDNGRLIHPDAFLPAAIRFGLMSEIDLWVIRHAAEAYAEYATKIDDLQLSINLSANAFEADDLSLFVEKTFAEWNVIPDRIIFEITESLAVRRPLHVERQMHGLRDLGCKLALDDFGTGYSSFSYLQKLHFDYIKIDGAFVQDILNNPVDQKMIRLIAEIGREVKMQTIAEYVQNAESLSLLGELGVDLAQGYFIGRPTKRPQFKKTPISLNYQRNLRSSRK